jgi:MFS transporter, FHS family, L-fucose permease
MAAISGTGSSAKAVSSSNEGSSNGGGNPYKLAFILVTALFFVFGFITCLNDILVPHLKSLFTLNYTQAALVQFCFFSAYFFASLPSGKIVTRLGYKRGTILGVLIAAVGCLLFYPAAGLQSYNIFLFGLFVLASGITLIQVAVNPYVAVLGPSESASARLTLAQAFNSLGTTIAPAFGSYLILSAGLSAGTDKVAQASAVQGPYIGLAVTLVVLAVIVGMSHLPTITAAEGSDEASGKTAQKDKASAWQYKRLVLGAVGIFCYVGAEVAIGSYLVNFLGLTEIQGYSAAAAAYYVSYYWGGAMVGRFIGSWVMGRIKPSKVLAFNALCAAALVLIAMATGGKVAMYAILAVGLFNSIMFPTIFTLAIDGLGKNTAQGSGILCMAIVGGAIIPLIQGTLADSMGLHHSYVLPVLCYIFITYYGMKGYRADNYASDGAAATSAAAADIV